MEWSSWRNYYETNKSRAAPEVGAAPEVSGEERRRALARSFAVFQLGEAGEGRIATEIDRTYFRTIDDDYRVSLKHWVREEGRHGRVLGTAVRALGGRPESKNWTNDLLVVGRRLLGVRLKLLVILTAEVVGVTFYGLIARALGPGQIHSALLHIVGEEEAHLRFHTRFFRAEASTAFTRCCFTLAWWLVGLAACAVVLVDHRRTLKLLGIPKRVAASAFVALLYETQVRVVAEEAVDLLPQAVGV